MYKVVVIFFLTLIFSNLLIAFEDDDDDTFVEDHEEIINEEVDATFFVDYTTPKSPPRAYFVETFDDNLLFEKKWIKSKAKKNDVDDAVAKYDGLWSLESLEKDSLSGDQGLVLKSKAKHAAISAALARPFVFKDKPLVVQYEINLQNGQDCGGSYIKLLSQPKNGKMNLEGFHDKTAYTIMFGPDKCGNDDKFHFIFRHVNPLNGSVEEKHCKRPEGKFGEIFKDKNPHLYTLVVEPTNTFEIFVDNEKINSGHLLEDFTPSINPPKEIDDPEDFKPADWDERENIPDPEAVKPDDWDEDAPIQIVDQSATKPAGWLDEESELIPDPDSIMPDDWDNEMDGDWEAPLVNNPKCVDAPGCGEWKPPMIDNPNYKGKWVPPTISNPNYKGKWSPRRIANPHYFEDLEPFKMTPIGAVGIELWSMSDNIYFDNILITDNIEEARKFAAETFDLKVLKVLKGQKSMITRIIEFSNENPWIHAVYVAAAAVVVVIVYICCCGSSQDKEEDEAALRKKTDEPSPDDACETSSNKKDELETQDAEEEEEEEADSKEDEEEEEESDEKRGDSEKETQSGEESPRTSPRQRKVRKE